MPPFFVVSRVTGHLNSLRFASMLLAYGGWVRVTGLGLACGLGHSAALTCHRHVIHYRSAFKSCHCT